MGCRWCCEGGYERPVSGVDGGEVVVVELLEGGLSGSRGSLEIVVKSILLLLLL